LLLATQSNESPAKTRVKLLRIVAVANVRNKDAENRVAMAYFELSVFIETYYLLREESKMKWFRVTKKSIQLTFGRLEIDFWFVDSWTKPFFVNSPIYYQFSFAAIDVVWNKES
jgi:hypothetical protein